MISSDVSRLVINEDGTIDMSNTWIIQGIFPIAFMRSNVPLQTF